MLSTAAQLCSGPALAQHHDDTAATEVLRSAHAEPILLPQLGQPADAALSPQQEDEIGANIVAQMYHYDYVLDDAELADYLTGLAWRLAAHSSDQPPQLTTFWVRDPRINAFALPGGYIGFNVGLLLAARNESEVAGVMAHELAHVTQRHIARSVEAQEGTGVATLAMFGLMLAAMLSGSADADAVMGAMAIGQSALYQQQVSFTRGNELEADRIGIRTLIAAGFDPRGMVSFFSRLEQQSRLYGAGVPEILRTHPVNSRRVAEAEARAGTVPLRNVPDSLDFALMQARARVLVAARASEPMAHYRDQLKADSRNPGARYGLALSLQQSGMHEEAASILRPLLSAYPQHPGINLLMAEIDQSAGRPERAVDRLQQVIDWYPRHAPTLLGLAHAFIESGAPAKAREVLLSHDQAYDTVHGTYRLLADAALKQGNQAEASYQLASYLIARGDQGGALAQLDTALLRADIAEYDRARLAAKRNEVRAQLPQGYNPYAGR